MLSFILASQSPRRIELLKEAGYVFDVHPSGIDESVFDTSLSPAMYAETLAQAKAEDVAQQFPNRLILGADTIVDCDNEIIGKPQDQAHAKAIVTKLFSKSHSVITGLALIWPAQRIHIVTHDTTRIIPKHMTPEQIQIHLNSDTWQGKAGAYAIQENGDEFIDHVEGSFTNVVGLPMELLTRQLDEIFEQVE